MKMLTRRALLLAAAAATLLTACATGPADTKLPPIVFVHGNGDSAALWIANDCASAAVDFDCVAEQLDRKSTRLNSSHG